ncbi:carbohydrate ABC transporter permease [Xylanimonas ulmi]|uniref:Carbohydrate ABC transporter membrane protein 1 (CUT1 family) n=1 Tax=Xylanimonas ulmi TaxID=228973 RepID=A0A4Q7M344_9MICO|nr:sugar ABC transporter permease [Xylanibacterium ulmi]RZS62326.1 carbohydrate ABC transporter membrane protein 1 (CUT1 family) [Xylanibacterium ulmi]
MTTSVLARLHGKRPTRLTKKRPDGPFRSMVFSPKVAPYGFVFPFILTLAIFWIYPIGRSIVMSTQHIVPGYIEPVGVENYLRMWNDPIFWRALWNSVRYMLATLVILIPIPLLLALAVNSKLGSPRIKAFFKASMFTPALTSVVVAGIIFRLMFAEGEDALMNQMLGVFGLDPERWLRNDMTGLVALLVLALWRWTGVNMMYFLAGLQSIPAEYYEAAAIDGASKWQTFVHVTLPQVKPTIIFVVTISVFGGLSMFLESFMLWGGNNSPQNIGLTIIGYLYRLGIERNDLGFASAVGVVLLALVLIINLTQLTLTGFFKKEKRA